ncbi:MAG: T9SS type A sorting domain-containing protein, partial [Flavobacteriaceae bacterium]|nr:T9SS type A sorting domain-containing protein [Flavobacteriaceae bacterium]
MKIFTILLFFIVATNTVVSQNLVPNPSFEEYYDCPYYQGEFYVDFWFETPNSISSPDYYNDCSPDDTPSDVPENIAGSQYPYEGEGYAGIQCYGNDSGRREYIEIQLSTPLIENQEYEFSMYVSLADRFGSAINNLGVLITDYIVEGNGPGGANLIEANPQIKAESPLTDKDNWMQITGTFIAEGGEEYLTIGNFFSDEDTERVTVWPYDFLNWGKYYIDSVSLTQVILSTNENTLKSQLKIYPNPTNDFINIEIANNNSNIAIK